MTLLLILAVYDREVRASFPSRIPSTWASSSDGPLTRCLTGAGGFVLASTGLHDGSDAQIEDLVARTLEHYQPHGCPVEWKTFDHDDPRVLRALTRAGFTAATPEALVLGEVTALTGLPLTVPGVNIRQAGLDDLPAIAAMEAAVWGDDWNWFVPDMSARMDDPDPAHVLWAEQDGQVVSAAWLVPMPGTSFAGLWGGTTRQTHRRRGIYRALARARANEAARRGYRLLQVDASPDSRPILERLGLTVAGTTTPYWWRPSA